MLGVIIPAEDDQDQEPKTDTRSYQSNNSTTIKPTINGKQRPKRLSGIDPQCKVLNNTILPQVFDWRLQGDGKLISPVRDQGPCGSCWTFATASAIESALIRSKKAPSNVQLSEQQLVNCAKNNSNGDGCSGGSSYIGFNFAKANGMISQGEGQVGPRYEAKARTCNLKMPSSYRIKNFCLRSRYRYNKSEPKGRTERLTDDTLARALVQHGSLYTLVDASPADYRNYRQGVMHVDGCNPNRVNHAVLLVGYNRTENSWIIKNSWGTAWGESGYFRLIQGKNMCGINTEIAWPLL